jgi:hypothetical protein
MLNQNIVIPLKILLDSYQDNEANLINMQDLQDIYNIKEGTTQTIIEKDYSKILKLVQNFSDILNKDIYF